MDMERDEVEKIVTGIVRDVACLADDRIVLPHTDFRTELGTDSLFDAEFGMSIEDRFELEVPDGVRPQNISEVVDLILATKAGTAECGT